MKQKFLIPPSVYIYQPRCCGSVIRPLSGFARRPGGPIGETSAIGSELHRVKLSKKTSLLRPLDHLDDQKAASFATTYVSKPWESTHHFNELISIVPKEASDEVDMVVTAIKTAHE